MSCVADNHLGPVKETLNSPYLALHKLVSWTGSGDTCSWQEVPMDDHIQAAIFSPSWKGAKEGVSLICVLLCGKLDGKLNPLKIEEDLPYSFD